MSTEDYDILNQVREEAEHISQLRLEPIPVGARCTNSREQGVREKKELCSGEESEDGKWKKSGLEVRLAEEWIARCEKGLEATRKWFEKHAKTIFEEEDAEEVKVVDGKKAFGCEYDS
ncbi:hypothetical protein FN846DRAFT_902622 [Sphaerosporella brunnea]|uniref:Uncharacterized protein n=1 Tax=Sphaerosporella brunnea TaxID=1250544 RepID=A0A5J5F8Z7_9PEZI|nr:hypothetical protein FN846DRAFT_902622 [Sphaerosporella brunnea]